MGIVTRNQSERLPAKFERSTGPEGSSLKLNGNRFMSKIRLAESSFDVTESLENDGFSEVPGLPVYPGPK